MRKLLIWLGLVLLLCGCGAQNLPAPSGETTAPTPETKETAVPTLPEEVRVVQYADKKAIWLSQFDLGEVYRDGTRQREQEDFTARMTRILDNVRSLGFNTVFLQIRPYGDSMYPSAYYPMSAWVVGRAGAPADYDPVAIIVELAHERDLSIHGWINPMRGMTEEELLGVGPEYALRQWYDDPEARGTLLVPEGDRWYLNPAYDQVQALILAGALEALTRYDFDGLHMDDYFYPTTEPDFDAAAYGQYLAAGGEQDLAQFRRDVLSKLVAQLWSMTGESRPGRIFGISPAGNVDTVYHQQYADVYRWCREEGFLDYICPQVYFGLEHGSFDFRKVCAAYQDMIRLDRLELIVGMTFGKAFTGEDPWAGPGKKEWQEHRDVLARCLETTLELEHCCGVAVFSYQYLYDPVTGAPVAETALEQQNFFPVLQRIHWSAG